MHERMTAIVCEVANGFRQYHRFREQRIGAGCSVRCAPGRVGTAAGLQPPPPQKKKIEIKKKSCVDTIISNVLRDLPFNRNQPLKSADDL